MAQFETISAIDGLTGKLSTKDRNVMRQKKWHLPNGQIIKLGPKETYTKEPRDYTRHPRTAAEEAQHERWTSICREASRITHDPTHPRYAELSARFANLVAGTPDPLLGKRTYSQFGNFVRSVLQNEKNCN